MPNGGIESNWFPNVFPANKELLKVNNRKITKGVKYVQTQP